MCGERGQFCRSSPLLSHAVTTYEFKDVSVRFVDGQEVRSGTTSAISCRRPAGCGSFEVPVPGAARRVGDGTLSCGRTMWVLHLLSCAKAGLW